MRTVIAGPRPPEIEALIALRQQRGLDRHDEVWEGDYHMPPGPAFSHGQVYDELKAYLRPLAKTAGLIGSTTFNLGSPDDYRVPDGGYVRERADGVYSGTAALVVEVLSPGDETFEKFGFYARHGVEELLVADPDSRTVRIWELCDGDYVETGTSTLLDLTAATIAEAIDWP